MIRVEKNDARMVRLMCNIRPEDRTLEEELRSRLKFKSMKECVLDRRLHWLGHLDRLEGRAFCSKCRTFKESQEEHS